MYFYFFISTATSVEKSICAINYRTLFLLRDMFRVTITSSCLMKTVSLPTMSDVSNLDSTRKGCPMETVDGLLQEHDDTQNEKIKS
jgi:hypothetical protein